MDMVDEDISESTLRRDLDEMIDEGVVERRGQGKSTEYAAIPKGGLEGLKQIATSPTTKVTASTSVIDDEEPLVEVKVTNPLAYLKRWWQKVMADEGIKIKFSLEVKPLTAIGLVLLVAAIGVGLTTVSAMLKYLPFYSRFQQFVTSPDNSTETAMEGRLYFEGDKFYLFTANMNEAVFVQGVKKLELGEFDDKHVILTGSYNSQTNILTVETVRALNEVKQPTESELAPKPEATVKPRSVLILQAEHLRKASDSGGLGSE